MGAGLPGGGAAAAGAMAPIDDLGFVDVEAVVVVGGEARPGTDCAVDVDRGAAGATDEVMVVVADTALVAGGRAAGLDAAQQVP